MIWAVIRPEAAQRVIKALDTNGIKGMTRLNVTGRGMVLGIAASPVRNVEIPQEMLMMVVPNNEVAKTVRIIQCEAKADSMNISRDGTIRDGKIFITYVEDSFAIGNTGQTGGKLRV